MINITIPNFKKIQKALKSHPNLFRQEMQKAIMMAGFTIEKESKRVTPVDTGRLRGSIGTRVGFLEAIVAPKTDYAVFVHEGTRYMHSRPYMKWGVEKSERQLQELFKDVEVRILEKIAKKLKKVKNV